MDKLQLRLSQQQTTDLIEALDTALTRKPPLGTRARFIKLRAWLAYRSTRIWGQPVIGGGQGDEHHADRPTG